MGQKHNRLGGYRDSAHGVSSSVHDNIFLQIVRLLVEEFADCRDISRESAVRVVTPGKRDEIGKEAPGCDKEREGDEKNVRLAPDSPDLFITVGISRVAEIFINLRH